MDGIKRYEEGVEAFLGQRFHETMEWLYKERAFRVVPLDPFALEKAVAEGKWAPDVLERLKAYVGTEKRYTVMFKENL